ncbi:MAG: OmpA family protein [Polyangiaceae bacterium]|nr:OmpA family protein [Polyangiaceae bacterium]
MIRLRSVSLLSSLGVLLLSATASAEGAKSGEFSVQKFAPAPGPRNFITVSTVRSDGHKSWSLGAFVNYAANPLTLRSCRTASDCSSPNAVNTGDVHVVKTMVTGDLLASFTPIPRLQLGFRLPITMSKGDGIDTEQGTAKRGGLSGTGVGDPMLEAKMRLIGDLTSPIALGGAVFMSGPLGHATAKDKYIGDSSPVIGVRGIADFKAGPLDLGGNLAALYKSEAKLGSTEVGSAMRYGVGAAFNATPVIRLVAEGFGETKFSSKAGTNNLEIDGALHVHPLNSGINLYVGGGPGVIQGVGVPQFRAFAGIMYVREGTDGDGDGIYDADDKCPTDAEDRDGYHDEDGCPDPDNDGDGIKDTQDKCPSQPETMNGFQDDDGCPDDVPDRDADGIADTDDQCPDDGGATVVRAKGQYYGCPDRDKDGVPDKSDKCPDEPEDTDGFQDEDGCLDADNDGDGVLDAEDECVDQPGTRANKGCPDPDTDGDGIPDSKDKCKDKPETYNGYQDDDGCPDKAPGSLVEVTDAGIKILDRIEFATASDKIVGAKSFKILDQVATVLKANQSIYLVEIAGHTDSAGDPGANKALSQKRAESVKGELVKRGVSDKKLQPAGYGADKPIADNKDAKGRQANRRVEFTILKSAKKAGPAPATPAP